MYSSNLRFLRGDMFTSDFCLINYISFLPPTKNIFYNNNDKIRLGGIVLV